jgi:hypothetical protein
VGGRGWKELTGAGLVLRRTVGTLAPVGGGFLFFERMDEGFP